MTSMCATCTYWGDEDDVFAITEANASQYGMRDWRRCTLMDSADVGGHTTRNRAALAFAYCSDTYVGAALYTAPSFSCIQWEDATNRTPNDTE